MAAYTAPTPLERLRGLVVDLDHIADETVDLDTFESLAITAYRLETAIDDLEAEAPELDPAAAKRWIVAWCSAGGWLRHRVVELMIRAMGLRDA